MSILENDRAEKCYIDGAFCSGARFLFCDDCRKAMKYQKDEKMICQKTEIFL